MSFVHLHNHTDYSLLNSTMKIREFVKEAVEDGQSAIAITDSGVLFGTIEFYLTCKEHNIKPIIGMEAYITNNSRFDKPKQDERNSNHIIFFAKNKVGYKNLMKLSSIGFTEGFYKKPRIDKEVLEKYHEGLICTSAGMEGIINADIIAGNIKKAEVEADYYKNLFGDDFYIEIQRHKYINEKELIKLSVQIARERNIKIICTNNNHYLKKEHSLAHNVLLSINSTKDKVYNYKELKFKTDEFYFKTMEEMKSLFVDYPDAIANTLEIADKCNLEIDFDTLYIPIFPIPEDSNANNLNEYLVELANKMLCEKLKVVSPEYQERLNFELEVIIGMEFSSYLLITQDIINWAKNKGIPVGPGRGSVGGSLVAYALGITNIDPIKYQLIFERFLNPVRVSIPDIDIDFCAQNRHRVIEYVKVKYGEKAVAQIVIFRKLTKQAVLRDVGRVLGIPPIDVKKMIDLITTNYNNICNLKYVLAMPDMKEIIDTSKYITQDFLDISLTLENVLCGRETHSTGLIIAPAAISNYIPVCTTINSNDDMNVIDIVTQYSNNYGEIENVGMFKMDFLSLQTLTMISDIVKLIKAKRGEKIDIDKIPLDDKKTYKMLSDGQTIGVWQYESQGMCKYLKQLKPESIEDLTAMNALYRPGPMGNIPKFVKHKNNPELIKYLVPTMEAILKNTYGIIVYQEQVMKLLQLFGGFSLGEADIFRRAMGKKKVEVVDEMEQSFYDGCAQNNIEQKTAKAVFESIKKSVKFSFIKSHSVAYTNISYQTAWLKANYLDEFIAVYNQLYKNNKTYL